MPKWSNPDYVNELDPKIVDMLVEFHKSQGTLETPKAQVEIEQRRAELEDKKTRAFEPLEQIEFRKYYAYKLLEQLTKI